MLADTFPSPQSIVPEYKPVGEYGKDIGEAAVHIDMNAVKGVEVGVGVGVEVFVGVFDGVGGG